MDSEDLKILYNRAEQHSLAKFGSKFSQLHIDEDGQLKLMWWGYERGDETYEYVNVEDLTQDLDVLVAERKKREAEEAAKRAEQKRLDDIKHQEYLKRQRKAQYLKLKQEFENEES